MNSGVLDWKMRRKVILAPFCAENAGIARNPSTKTPVKKALSTRLVFIIALL
jgi:hypothetical protein